MPDILYAGSLTQDEVSTPFSLPTASRVAQIVSENGLESDTKLEFVLPPHIGLEQILVALKIQMIQGVSLSNSLKIHALQPGYTLFLQHLPKLKKRLKKQGWILTYDIFAGAPGDAEICTLHIEAKV